MKWISTCHIMAKSHQLYITSIHWFNHLTEIKFRVVLKQKSWKMSILCRNFTNIPSKTCQMVPAWNTFYYPHVRYSPLMICIFIALVCRSNFDCIRDNTKLFNDCSDYSSDSVRRKIDIKIVKLMFKQWSLMYKGHLPKNVNLKNDFLHIVILSI